jgi:hypothetical protein
MIAFLFAAAPAHAVQQNFDICVDYQTYFTDAVNAAQTSDGIGDHWKNNWYTKAAMRLEYEIEVNGTTVGGRLDTTGCLNRTIEIGFANTFEFTVYSNTERRGVDIKMRFNDDQQTDPDGDPVYYWDDAQEASVSWQGLSTSLHLQTTSHDLLLDATEGWQVLAVATWMIHRNKWNLHLPVGRPCCTGSGVSDNGECSGPSPTTKPYDRSVAPFLESDPQIWIHALEDEGTGADDNGCCGSRFQTTDFDPGPPSVVKFWTVGFQGGSDEQGRFTLAHELAHLIPGIRMGGREQNYPANAPDDGCEGSWSGGQVLPDSARGVFSKEYAAVSLREGWADWVSAWAWNVKGHADCDYVAGLRADFDLDGDIDNEWPGADWRDGIYSCRNHPERYVADTSDPTGSHVGDTNWLDEMITANQCIESYPKSCSSQGVTESHNRSTVYDVQRMFYALYKEEGLNPPKISDLYVDICPRQWRYAETDCSDGDDLPIRRLLFSAEPQRNNVGTQLDNQIDGVVH